MSSEFAEHLSPTGLRRREQILKLAQSEARSHRARRRSVRAIAACVVLLAAGWSVSRFNTHRIDPKIPGEIAVVPTPVQRHLGIEEIATDPKIVDRMAIKTSSPRWETIGDDDLLQTLNRSGLSAGLVSMEGKTVLVSDDMLPDAPVNQ